jgi:maltooligosyltrehalose trehalohydrolase
MHTFRVWGPRPKKLDVLIGEARYPLRRDDHDWWSADVEEAGPGTDYRFIIDGGDPVPDPRSLWQPEGVNGPSRVWDHNSFTWSDKRWQSPPLGSAVLYELHVGTFTPGGTFQSAIQKLDHLVDLGITHVEIMPVNEFSGDWGWGYDGVDLYAPHHCYGTPDDLKALVNACHEKGLAVLLDVVYNHLGPAGNYLDRFGPYFTNAYNTPWGSAVNLDHDGSFESRRFFADNALMWLRDYHFDGLRLDAVHALFDRSAINFLEFLACEVDILSNATGRHLILIAESDLNDPRIVTTREANGYGIDAQWSDDFHHALHTVLTGEQKGYYEEFGSVGQLAKSLQDVFVFDGCYSPHRGKLHGRPVEGLSGHHFLAYSQNHDQIGNRAQGERLSQLVSIGKQKIAAALVLTSPFVPMLFQGEEFSASTPFQYFTHHDDPDLAKRVSEGRRSEFKAFGWQPDQVPDPQAESTFRNSKLKWDEVSREPHASMLRWYKDLIALRRESPILTDGRLWQVDVEFDEEAQWLVVTRGSLQVFCNFSNREQQLPLAVAQPAFLSSDGRGVRVNGDKILLPPESVVIARAKGQASAAYHFLQHTAG